MRRLRRPNHPPHRAGQLATPLVQTRQDDIQKDFPLLLFRHSDLFFYRKGSSCGYYINNFLSTVKFLRKVHLLAERQRDRLLRDRIISPNPGSFLTRI